MMIEEQNNKSFDIVLLCETFLQILLVLSHLSPGSLRCISKIIPKIRRSGYRIVSCHFVLPVRTVSVLILCLFVTQQKCYEEFRNSYYFRAVHSSIEK